MDKSVNKNHKIKNRRPGMQRQTRWGSCTVDGGGAGGVNGVAVAEAQTAAAVGGAVVVAEVVVAGVGWRRRR